MKSDGGKGTWKNDKGKVKERKGRRLRRKEKLASKLEHATTVVERDIMPVTAGSESLQLKRRVEEEHLRHPLDRLEQHLLRL